jgi:hypothetical protein
MRHLYPAAAPAAPAAPAGAGAELDIGARLVLALDSVTAAAGRLAAARERDALAWEDCHPIDIAPVSEAAAGIITDERWQPRKNWAWQVLLLTVVFGGGATSAVLYKSADPTGAVSNNALKSFIPDAAGVAAWEPKGLILLPGQQLMLSSAGGGALMRGEAVEIALPRLPEYLM